MTEIRMLSTSGILGYGFPEASLEASLARDPHIIGVDGGSVDPGPFYLGSGKPFCSITAIRRDLRLMLKAAIPRGIKVVIGTCGGAGGRPHLELVARLAREIAAEEDLSFKLALIHAEQTAASVQERIVQGAVAPLGRMEELSADTVERAERVVGMMGPEPFMEALEAGADVILAGRASDPAPWAACAMHAGLPPAPSWYAGKMLECGATPSVPKGHDCLLVTVRDEGVECEPMNPARRCTPLSIANHSLHENASPIHHVEPGGILDTSGCDFEALSDRAVAVRGMTWTPTDYTVKLEAAELVGYRAMTFCGTRDPMLIAILDDFLEAVRANTAAKAADLGADRDAYTLIIRCYGKNGVMGDREPVDDAAPHEIGFLVEVVAASQEMASFVLALARTQMLHTDFPNRMCREGNMAFPFSPSDCEGGPVYRFSMHHVVRPASPTEMFPITYETV